MRTLAAVVLIVLACAVFLAVRHHQQSVAPLLPLTFEHSDHRDEPCATCHHNYVDDTGAGTCLGCHKSRAALAADIEPTFHDFCRGCHIKRQREGKKAGPTRACNGCHH